MSHDGKKTKKCGRILYRYLDGINTLYTQPSPSVILGSIDGDNTILDFPESVVKIDNFKSAIVAINKPKTKET